MDFEKRLTSDELSSRGRIKTFTHKWICFEKLRMYEHIGTPNELMALKERDMNSSKAFACGGALEGKDAEEIFTRRQIL